LTLWEGIVVAEYVDNGAFVNFSGQSIKFVQKSYSIGFGL